MVAKTGTVSFKNKDGREFVISVREYTDSVGDKTLEVLAKRGIHLPENAPLAERKALGAETVRQLVDRIDVLEPPDGRRREATKQERLGLLAFDSVANAIIKKGRELHEEEEAVLELVSGNSEAPSESSSA